MFSTKPHEAALRLATRTYRDADRRTIRIAEEFLPAAETTCDRSTMLHWLAGEEIYLADLVSLGSRLLDETEVEARVQSHLWTADLAGMIAAAEHAVDHDRCYRPGGFGLESDGWVVYLLGSYTADLNPVGRAAVLDSLATHLHQRGYTDRVRALAVTVAAALRATATR